MVASFFSRVIKQAGVAGGRPVLASESTDRRALEARAAIYKKSAARSVDDTDRGGGEASALATVSGEATSLPSRGAAGDLTRDEVSELLAAKPRILSIDSKSPLFCDPEQRKSLIVFETGLMVVAKAHRDGILVSDMLNRAQNGGTRIREIRTADLQTIELFYGGKRPVDLAAVDMTRWQAVLYERIADAAKSRAADIHIKTEGAFAHIAYTLKGDFTPILDMSREDARRLMIAAFNLCASGDKQLNDLKPRQARLDSAENFRLPKGVQALRLQFTPLENNNVELCARILYSDDDKDLSDIDALGYEPPQIAALNVMRRQAYGIILISGPTGSGKSTTLKVALERTWADRGGRSKIVTIEDPPEYKIRGASQIPIESGASLEEKSQAFTRAMSSMLRMAPHIGMVGEIREAIGAKLTFDMAKTGHLVWASVHANTALDTIIRVRDMGVGAIDLEDPQLMRGLIAQRLVKAVCQHCSLPFNDVLSGKLVGIAGGKLDGWVRDFYGDLGADVTINMRLANPEGCSHCRDENGRSSGHVGRRVVAETIVPDRQVLNKVLEGHVDAARSLWLEKKGAATMLEHGFARVLRGEVSPLDLTYVGDVSTDLDTSRLAKIFEVFALPFRPRSPAPSVVVGQPPVRPASFAGSGAVRPASPPQSAASLVKDSLS